MFSLELFLKQPRLLSDIKVVHNQTKMDELLTKSGKFFFTLWNLVKLSCMICLVKPPCVSQTCFPCISGFTPCPLFSRTVIDAQQNGHQSHGHFWKSNQSFYPYSIECFHGSQELWGSRKPRYWTRQFKSSLWLAMQVLLSTTGIYGASTTTISVNFPKTILYHISRRWLHQYHIMRLFTDIR